MIFRILKKDMKRKKSVNFILFLFIIIATIFLASSVNNMLAVTNATTYFMDKTGIPDEFVTGRHIESYNDIDKWLEDNELVNSYSSRKSLLVGNSNVSILDDDGKKVPYDTDNTVYLEPNTDEYVKIVDDDGDPIHVDKGHVAVLVSEAKRLGIEVGDKLYITSDDKVYELTVSHLNKDAIYSGNMAGMIRFIVNEDDFEIFSEAEDCVFNQNYYVNTDDTTKFEKAFNSQAFEGNYTMLNRNTVKLIFAMDLIMAGMLTAIGVCLILIAVLVLRFTIVFTIEEEFREIGIMKAIGIRSIGIKGTYLIKYFVIVVTGSVIGCIASFPLGNFMLKSVSGSMVMESSANNGLYNILCALAVIVIVMLLCYLSMRKLNKLSVMDAIRNGQTGERFKKKSIFRLGKSKGMKVPLFLAINDIVCNIKQYIVLLLVFALGIVLIIIPINTITTMTSTEMSDQFILDRDATAFLAGVQNSKGKPFSTVNELEDGVDAVKQQLIDKGYDADVSAISIMFMSYRVKGSKSGALLLTTQLVNSKDDYLIYTEGTAPKLENEIAISSKSMEELGVELGDSIQVSIGGKPKTFIITATYQDYAQLGKSARMNTAIDLSDNLIYNYWSMPIYVNSDLDDEELLDNLKEDFPDYEFETAQDVVNKNIGGVVDTINGMKIWLVILMAAVNVFITILMMKMFIIREKGQIAMLHSIGFKNRTIRQWQILRIVGLLIAAVILAIPLSRVIDMTVLKYIFGIMGADVNIHVVPLQAYVLYPAIMLVGIMAAAFYTTLSVKDIDIRELSNLE